MGYQAIHSDKKNLLKSQHGLRDGNHHKHLPNINQQQDNSSQRSLSSPNTKNASVGSGDATLPPLDPHFYYQSQLQQPQIIPQPQRGVTSRRNTEPSGELEHDKTSPLNPFPRHSSSSKTSIPSSQTTHRGQGIILPPLSTIALSSLSSPVSSEPASRDNSFTGLPGQRLLIASQLKEHLLQEQQQFQQQPTTTSTQIPIQQPPPQPPPQQIPQQQQQQQQSAYYQQYPMYTSLPPMTGQNSQEFQYPGYMYPPPPFPPKDPQLPMPLIYQTYSPQYGVPVYQQLPPQPNLLLQLQAPQIHQIIYHPHPGFNFNGIDNTKKIPRRRTRTGCLTCRKRRIKCDERKPHCLNCEKSRKVCLGYEQPPFQNRNRKYKDGISLDNEDSDESIVDEHPHHHHHHHHTYDAGNKEQATKGLSIVN